MQYNGWETNAKLNFTLSQILASNNKQAIAVALASGLQFVRVEGFVYGHVADEGYTDACAGELLR